MSSIAASVTRGQTFTEDAEGRILVNKDRLNDLGVPTVTVPLTDSIETEDIKDAQVTAAKLSADLKRQLPIVTSSVAAQVGNGYVDVSVQLKDASGALPANKYKVNGWLTDASDIGTLTTTAPNNGFSVVTSGTELYELVTNKRIEAVTNATGLVTFRVDATGATTASYTWYLNIEVAGIIYTSDVITVTIA